MNSKNLYPKLLYSIKITMFPDTELELFGILHWNINEEMKWQRNSKSIAKHAVNMNK
jgi:hypothetical protein